MSSKKRKKPNVLSKQEEAHCKKIFSQKVMEIAKMVTLHESHKLITPEMLDAMFCLRSRMFRMVADESAKLSNSELQKFKNQIVNYLKNDYYEFKNTGNKASVYDWAGPGLTLFTFLESLRKKHAEKYSRLFMVFEDYMNNSDLWFEIHKRIHYTINYVGWQTSSPDKRIYSLKATYKSNNEYLFIEVLVKSYPPEICYVSIDNNSRPVFRVSLAFNGDEPLTFNIEASKLGLKHLPGDTKLPVYIQSHALKRLAERIDCAENVIIITSLFESLESLTHIWYKGGLLFEYRIAKLKIGYLLVDIIDKIAVIRTFLMLTHFETPEGDSLSKLMGSAKPDIAFMNLDKVSTFAYSNLSETSVLRDLLVRSGCGSLLQLKRELFDTDNEVSMASQIESHLCKYQEYNAQFELDELPCA